MADQVAYRLRGRGRLVGVTEVDIELMQEFLRQFDHEVTKAIQAADAVRVELNDVYLSCPQINTLRWDGPWVGQALNVRKRCQRVLDKAIEVRNDHAGIPVVRTDPYGYPYVDYRVTFDDTELSVDDARQAATMMTQIQNGDIHLSDGIPPDLVSMITNGATDTVFSTTFAGLVPPAQLGAALVAVDGGQSNLLAAGPSDGLAQYQASYARLLDGLGGVYSRAMNQLPIGSTQRQTAIDSWCDVFTSSPAHDPIPALVSMVVARGQWSQDMLTGLTDSITTTETSLGAWQPWWGTDGTIRTITDPGRTYQDGSPVVVSDPMYGVLSAAAYNPDWFLHTYQNADPDQRVDVTFDRTGYDGAEFVEHIPTHAMVDPALAGLMTTRGLDPASVFALLQAASVANTWQDVTGRTPTVMADVAHITAGIDRSQRLFNDLSWWEKYHHQLLEATSFALGTAAMIVPGTGWVIGGLLMGCFTTGVADVTLYAMEGDTPDAIISGVFLLPLAIGGTIKLVQLSREAYTALKAGQTVEELGQTLQFADNGALTVIDNGPDIQPIPGPDEPVPGKTVIIDPDRYPPSPSYGDPLPDHGTLANDPVTKGTISPDLRPLYTDPDAPYGRTPDGVPYTKPEYEQRYINAGGAETYPGNDGYVLGSERIHLSGADYLNEYGPYLDRIGSERGDYLAVSPDGVPATFEERGLGTSSLSKEYYQYMFSGNLPEGWHIKTGIAAPACGRPGGATQVQIFDEYGKVMSIRQLLDAEVLVSR